LYVLKSKVNSLAVIPIFRMVKKMFAELIDWFLYKKLSERHKQALANLFTHEQKNKLKSLIAPGKKRNHVRTIERLRYRLNNLGFTKRALADLEDACCNGDDLYMKRLAAWELATWYANQYSEKSAVKCLEYIKIAINKEKDKDIIRRAAILSSESYSLLGQKEDAWNELKAVMTRQKHADLYMAAASLESSSLKRIEWMNKALELHGHTPIILSDRADSTAYDRMKAKSNNENKQHELSAAHKVTVIIPAFNAEDVIRTSLESVLAQTWRNLEVIVVDDFSTDSTVEIVEEYEKMDSRVRLIKAGANGCAYVSRNLALQADSGEFVTINDADDWSHPEKIETQVLHLVNNKGVIGNFSQQARMSNELSFNRRGKPGIYMFANMSSFMFRREKVFSNIGYWDCVRFGGDSEYVKRIKRVFGEKSVVQMSTGPLSFQRQSETSLTGHSAFGFPGFFMGARKEYAEAHEYYHKQNVENLFMDFPLKERLFPVPEPMLPGRSKKRRHFDVIILSEFRLLGGTNMSNMEEIKANKEMGLTTGLIQMYRYDLNSVGALNSKVRELIDGDRVQMLVYGEKVSCDVLIVRHPPVLQNLQRYIPDVEAKSIHIIVNQPPKRDYGENGLVLYNMKDCVENLGKYFGKQGVWYPIGPKVRETLHKHHSEELTAVTLHPEDWVNIINVREWGRNSRPNNPVIKIGRHSRDQYVKWPDTKEEILQIYPAGEEMEVSILGGAKAPKKLLGELPDNWTVYDFGQMEPRAFLADLDVFVYYTHKDWVEAFGRVIFEAMAVGVPVIIAPHYQNLFKEAAIYAEPEEVKDKIHQLMNDEAFYISQVEKAQAYVEKQFGYSKHASRLEKILDGR
jgi:glycosyltransferase involved in cell wall biosynthesis